MMWDVLVIGSGIAGLLAAQSALAIGAKVLQIADGSGSSPYIHGACVPMLAQDSVECLEEDTNRSGCHAGMPELVHTLCLGSMSVLPMLEKLGITINQTDGKPELLRPLGSTYPRVISAGNSLGAAVIAKLRDILRQNPNYTRIDGLRAMKLYSPSCALCHGTDNAWQILQAKAIVLACGGYCGIYPFSTNSSDLGGDGIAMAAQLGAALRDMEYVQFEPSAAVYPDAIRGKSVITTLFYEGAVLRNGSGKRFTEELVNKDILTRAIYREIHQGNASPHGGVFMDATNVSPELWQTKYHSYYQRYRNADIDISSEYMEIAPAAHTASGGVAIDAHCGTNIDGLFACGEAAGGIHGANRLGGNAGLEVLVFGGIAGRSAAEYALTHTIRPERIAIQHTNPVEYPTMRKRLNAVMAEKLNVLRAKSGLREAVAELEELCAALQSDGAEYTRLRLYNDACCALQIARAALANPVSRGGHFLEEGA